MPTFYKSNKELAKLATLRCNLIELEFRKRFLRHLDEVYLKKIHADEMVNNIKKKLIDRLHTLKLIHLIFSLVISKRVMIAV